MNPTFLTVFGVATILAGDILRAFPPENPPCIQSSIMAVAGYILLMMGLASYLGDDR